MLSRLTDHNVCTILAKSAAESETLVDLLNSRFQRFVNAVTNENCNQYINFVKHFAGVPLNQPWTAITNNLTS